MTAILVRGLEFAEIVALMRLAIEEAVELAGGARVITVEALERILDRCDDVDHAREPLAQAVYEFVLAHEATITLNQ